MTSLTITDSNLKGLKDQVVVITGASSGIGLATLQILLHHGAQIFASDLNPLPPPYSKVPFLKTDVTSWTDQLALFKAAVQHYSHIDHVFANAGIGFTNLLLEDDLDADGNLAPPSTKTIDVNLVGVMYTAKLAHHYMKSNPHGGSLVLTGSASSLTRFAATDYAATKHAVLGLMRALHTNPLFKLRVNMVAPSWTDTAILPPEFTAQIAPLVQAADVVAQSAALLMADGGRDGECVYSERGRCWEVEKGEAGLNEGLRRMMPEADVEGCLAVFTGALVAQAKAEAGAGAKEGEKMGEKL